jgi:hypothetical protein
VSNCTQPASALQLFLHFPGVKKIVGTFDVPKLSSDGGLVLCAGANEKLGLAKLISECLVHDRQSGKIKFHYEELVKQRLNMIVTGNEDLNDADRLFNDPMHKIACGRNPDSDPDLASDSTLLRFESERSDEELERLEELLVRLWISKQRKKPVSITIDWMEPTTKHMALSSFRSSTATMK